jgi:hypothetical protein
MLGASSDHRGVNAGHGLSFSPRDARIMADDTAVPDAKRPSSWSRGSRILLAIVLVALASIRLGLGAGISPSYLPYLVDDALFIAQAEALLEGDWMGSYDHRRLVKGPGYPAFLALAASTGLGRRLAEDLLHGLASLLIYRLLRRLGAGRIPSALAFGLTLFHPVLFTESMVRVIRDGFYSSLTLVVLALASTIPLPATTLRRAGRAFIAGLPLAWLWVTRGEGLWIAPALACLLAGAYWLDRREGLGPRARFLRFGLTALLLAAPTLLGVFAWAETNERHYGLAVRQELKAPGFNAAMGAVNRVAATQALRYEPLNAELRGRLYEVSPAFAELRPLLETDAYRSPATSAENGERMAIFRSWLIRDAAARAGHHADPARAERYYRRLADEINRACEAKLLPAAEARRDQMPAFDLPTLRRALGLATGYACDLVFLERDISRPGLRLPELAVTPDLEASFSRVLARPFGRDIDGVFPRIAVLRACVEPLRMLSLIFALAAGFGLLLCIFGRRSPVLTPLSLAALAWILALISRFALVALAEAAWFRNVENYLIPAYLLFPTAAALAASAGRHAVLGARRLGPRLESGVLVTCGLVVLGSMAFEGLRIADLFPAISLLHDPQSGARVFGLGLSEIEESPRGEFRVWRRHPELHLYRPRKELPPEGALELAMDLGEVEYGRPFIVDLVVRDSREGRKVDSRLLAAKGPGLKHWRLPLEAENLDHVRVRLPEMKESRLRLREFAIATVAGLPASGPRPGAPLRGNLDRAREELSLSIEAAEPNVTYRVFLARELAPEGQALGNLEGQAFLDAERALRDPRGAAYVFDLITDEFGRAERRLRWPSDRPDPRFAQGMAPQSLSAPTAIAILNP